MCQSEVSTYSLIVCMYSIDGSVPHYPNAEDYLLSVFNIIIVYTRMCTST